jgi:hypothetical protein
MAACGRIAGHGKGEAIMRLVIFALASGMALSAGAYAQQATGDQGTVSGKGASGQSAPAQGSPATAKSGPATGTPAAPSSGQPAEVVKTKTKSNQSND